MYLQNLNTFSIWSITLLPWVYMLDMRKKRKQNWLKVFKLTLNLLQTLKAHSLLRAIKGNRKLFNLVTKKSITKYWILKQFQTVRCALSEIWFHSAGDCSFGYGLFFLSFFLFFCKKRDNMCEFKTTSPLVLYISNDLVL